MPANAYLGRTFVKADATVGKIIFGIQQASGGSATDTTTTYNLNTTYHLVLKHDIVGKTSSIIINPTMTTGQQMIGLAIIQVQTLQLIQVQLV